MILGQMVNLTSLRLLTRSYVARRKILLRSRQPNKSFQRTRTRRAPLNSFVSRQDDMRESLIPRDQIEKVSYVRHLPRDGRVVPLLTCFSPGSKEWRLFVEGRPGEIHWLDAEPISGS